MITFDMTEIISAIVLISAYGAFTGVLRNILYSLPAEIISLSKANVGKNDLKDIGYNELFKFIFYIAIGIYYILLQFVLLDGQFRFYLLVFFTVAHAMAIKATKTVIKRILNFIVKKIYTFLINPIIKLFVVISKISKKIHNILSFKQH